MNSVDQRAAARDSFVMIFLKHMLIVLGAFSLWAAADSWQHTSSLPLAAALSVLNGLVAGALLATVVHEWSHLAAAWAFASRFTFTPDRGLFVFNFDLEHNSNRQFLAMSLGGNIGGWLLVFALPQLLPLDDPGARMLHGGMIAAAIFAAAIEVPVIQGVRAGQSPAEALGGITREKLYRAGTVGIGTGLAYWLLFTL